MAKCDFRSLENFSRRLDVAAKGEQKQKFYEDCCKELAARFLRKVVKRTPTGEGSFMVKRDDADSVIKFKRGKNKGRAKLERLTNGGTLQRGWTEQTEEKAAHGHGKPNILSYLATLKVQRVGNDYHVTITNVVRYASYVEYGHRQIPGRYIPVLGKRTKAGWVKGQFMMTVSLQELVDEAPRVLARKLDAFLRGVMNGT